MKQLQFIKKNTLEWREVSDPNSLVLILNYSSVI